MNWPVECIVIIPCLNEGATISGLVEQVKRVLPHIVVVDDGSNDDTAQNARNAGAQVIRHERTLGKGAALQTGTKYARQKGVGWVLTMDGDGQHAPEDVSSLLSAAEEGGADLIIGNRMADTHTMPWIRRMVNRWMSGQLSRLAGISIPDSQCGFRLMRMEPLSSLSLETSHFEIESEVLWGFIRRKLLVRFVPVRTIYKEERSKIHPVRDTIRWLRWWRHARRSIRSR
ncbi:glycosyltransferase family 2 protein [Pedosphaera parvula]|uniref:Glycosyl transferase family 2 n=1 Tax=Pedosphaera parvula (strain Ellin514) TaxID=320771 RepID=B9XG99_PEDPL|nr:glycosyltransferase family 2 protein [Pedosphaera parvula]EEF61261.1 glycosyl transferase family 2 [Pedosphaera parvula Ellin514]